MALLPGRLLAQHTLLAFIFFFSPSSQTETLDCARLTVATASVFALGIRPLLRPTELPFIFFRSGPPAGTTNLDPGSGCVSRNSV